VRLEPLYRVTFLTPEGWSVRLDGKDGSEGQSFLIAEGRSTGRLSARYRAANFPRQRTDGTVTPDFRGVLETDDGDDTHRMERVRAIGCERRPRARRTDDTRHRRRALFLAERSTVRRRRGGPPEGRWRRVRRRHRGGRACVGATRPDRHGLGRIDAAQRAPTVPTRLRRLRVSLLLPDVGGPLHPGIVISFNLSVRLVIWLLVKISSLQLFWDLRRELKPRHKPPLDMP